MLYDHIPGWPEERPRPLLERFGEMLMEQGVLRKAFVVIGGPEDAREGDNRYSIGIAPGPGAA